MHPQVAARAMLYPPWKGERVFDTEVVWTQRILPLLNRIYPALELDLLSLNDGELPDTLEVVISHHEKDQKSSDCIMLIDKENICFIQ